jgi:shikimate dehydrogenase
MLLFDPDPLRAENTDCIASEQIDPHVTPLRTHYIEQLVTPSVHSMP